MTKRNIFILEEKENPWRGFLEEFFEDTPATLHVFCDSSEANTKFNQPAPDMAFINPHLLSLPLTQKINVLRNSSPEFRVFQLGTSESSKGNARFDDTFDPTPDLMAFQKKLANYLPLPEVVRVLVVDDEPEIGAIIRDFLGGRTHPVFEVECADNGEEGLKAIDKQTPDVLILDIKMPVKDGREVYREITEKGLKIPVIVFFDAISGDEVVEIHKMGKPAVVEKGSRQSEMPVLLYLIKKMVYFG